MRDGAKCVLGSIPEHPALTSRSGLSRGLHQQTLFSNSSLIVIILHYDEKEGVEEQNRPSRLLRTIHLSTQGRI